MTEGRRVAGNAVVDDQDVIEAKALPTGWSAQRAELWALIRALELGQGKRINIYTDSTYAFATLQVHGAIYHGGERGLLMAKGKEIKNKKEILQLLEAVWALTKVAVIHCKGHQKLDTMVTQGNQRADQAAKEPAVGPDRVEVTTLLLGPLLDVQIYYAPEENSWAHQAGCQQSPKGEWRLPDGRIYIPQGQAGNLVRQCHCLTHTVKTSLENLLKRYFYFPNLAKLCASSSAQCITCA